MHRLREQGLKVTPSRVSIMLLLQHSKKPLSADELYSKTNYAINRATVYRVLSLLEKVGMVSRFTFQNRHVYEVAQSHNHYLICKWCKTVEQIPSCSLDTIEQTTLKASKAFSSVDQHMLQLTGTCKKCA